MAAFKRGSHSCTSIAFDIPNLTTDDNSLLPVRCNNVEQTLKDLELMKNKNKKCFKSKSTSNINFTSPSTKDRRHSKQVRFDDGVRETCSEKQIYVPLWKRTENLFRNDCDNCIIGGGQLRKIQSDAGCQSKRLSNQKYPKHCSSATETGTTKLFGKLKRFWQGLGSGKQKRIKNNKDSDSRFSGSNRSNDSCDSLTESMESETSGYVTSKTIGKHEIPKSSASEASFDYSCEDLQNRQQTCSHCAQIQNFEHSKQHVNEDWNNDFARRKEQCKCAEGKSEHDMSFNTLRCFWEPRNGFNEGAIIKENDSDACTYDIHNLENDNPNSRAHMRIEKGNGLKNNNEKQAFQSNNFRNWQDFSENDLSPKTSTETLVETRNYDSYIPSISSHESKGGTGFLNFKTSPICCSLHSNSNSCKENESDIKKTIRCLKKAMKLRKKMQKLELNQLKEDMRKIKKGCPRRSDSSKSSSCTFSSATANHGSLSNLLAGSRSSHSSPACSLVTANSSDVQFRTVLNGHACHSVPNASYFNYSSQKPNCAQFKQQFTLRKPIWSQPLLTQNQPTMKNFTCISQTRCFERPKLFYNQAEQKPMPCFNFDQAQELNRPEAKANNSSCDPTRYLWNEILLNTPCDVSNANESLITCYVGMYRKQAAEAQKNHKGCVIDPLEFRYGYQNEKHSNGPVKVVKKGDAQVVYNCRMYGKKRRK